MSSAVRIPHDEAHRFLQWGSIDQVFNAWCKYFDEKGIDYDVGGSWNRWTIYKHMTHTTLDEAVVTKCCVRST